MTNDGNNNTSGTKLHPDDAAAIDALVAARMDVTGVPHDLRPRAQHILDLLASLEAGERGEGGSSLDSGREELIRATLGRVSVVSIDAAKGDLFETRGWVGERRDLHPLDGDALDALVSHGYEPARVPTALRARATHQRHLLDLLGVPPARLGEHADREALVAGTLALVRRDMGEQRGRMSIERFRRGPSWRLSDLVAVAAMLLIGTALTMPAVVSWRDSARQNACAANLHMAGLGFGMYAGDNRDAMPMASASLAGTPWWAVGENPAQSNSANLFTLARTQYTRGEDLSCAAGACAVQGQPPKGMMDWASLRDVTYSYQNMFGVQKRAWVSAVRFEVLADRSPVILRARAGQMIDPMENSPNHGGRGQLVLYNDGASSWLLRPVNVRGDNLWLPRSIEALIARAGELNRAEPLKGTESPEDTGDTFLVP